MFSRTTVFYLICIGCIGTMSVEGFKWCYEQVCYTPNCLQEYLQKYEVPRCLMNETYGCYVEKKDSGLVASCATDDCIPYHYEVIPDFHTSTYTEKSCCNEQFCNQDNGTIVEAGKNQCYLYSCTSQNLTDNCLEKGIDELKVSSCVMDPALGCYAMGHMNGNYSLIQTGCVAPGEACKYTITKASDTEMIHRQCCMDDLCNDKEILMTTTPVPTTPRPPSTTPGSTAMTTNAGGESTDALTGSAWTIQGNFFIFIFVLTCIVAINNIV